MENENICWYWCKGYCMLWGV